MTANPDQAPNSRAGVAIHVPYWLGGDPKQGGAARDMLLRVNFNLDGTVREVFARPFKTGADLEGLLDKFCIGVSRALKFGDTIENFWACIDGTGHTPVEGQDIFTAVVRGALMLERESLAINTALVKPPAIPGEFRDTDYSDLPPPGVIWKVGQVWAARDPGEAPLPNEWHITGVDHGQAPEILAQHRQKGIRMFFTDGRESGTPAGGQSPFDLVEMVRDFP